MIELKYNVKLYPIRIPAGWHIENNKIFEVEPEFPLCGNEHFNEEEFFEDFFETTMFLAANEHKKRYVDIGWYPAWDKNGMYKLEVKEFSSIGIQGKAKVTDGVRSIYSFSSRSTKEIVEHLEGVLIKICKSKL